MGDAGVAVALASVATTFLGVLGAIVVAIVNSRKERGDVAEGTMQGTLRERILLRDEQIAELRDDLTICRAVIAERDEHVVTLQALLQTERQNQKWNPPV